MDQGIAGVIAGCAGLLGAGVGGLATAYGARVGAQKTVEAAHAQAERQSTSEHLHWIREQRRQVYSDVLASHAPFRTTAIKRSIELSQGRPLPPEENLRFEEQILQIAEVTARADLWGPASVLDAAHEMSRAGGDKYIALIDWSQAIRAERSDDTLERSQQYAAALAAYGQARALFVQAAVNALQF
ncbi:hypothetical protein [Streptomyces rubiginosohelvolus]|uniref:hypothetical protein n=1 Tax=Streptomyces rubiginosohelvolus TaxID=67362 RepID=UPI003692B7D7